jgi:DNA-directed RNA polymerase specialized sigma24 family protein
LKASDTDFHYVPPEQAAIHERLLNWAKWVNGSGHPASSPMFAAYRSTEVWAAPEASQPVDTLDAKRLESAIATLDQVEREAIRWHYVNTRRHSPSRACRWLGLAKQALAQAVIDGRESLQARLTHRGNPVSSAERMSL